MPALPWQQMQPTDPEQEYVVMSSRLPLRAYRFIPGFLRDTLRIRRQLRTSGGLVGYGLNAELTRKTFWTYSVWTDKAAIASLIEDGADAPETNGVRVKVGKVNERALQLAGPGGGR